MTEIQTFPTRDPRLGWFSEHDPRSENFQIRELLAGETPADQPKQWTPGAVLDQGREGACVGFGWTGDLLGSPRPFRTDAVTGNGYALSVYRAAQQRDGIAGPHEGTSVLAGAKEVTARGYYGSYHWAESIEDVRDAVIVHGPVVIGIPWYESMYETRPSGLVEAPSGDLVGGHCLLVYGYHPAMRIAGEDWNARYKVFRWRNSWGSEYGVKGNGLIRYEDLRDLLSGWGEACLPTERRYVRALV